MADGKSSPVRGGGPRSGGPDLGLSGMSFVAGVRQSGTCPATMARMAPLPVQGRIV